MRDWFQDLRCCGECLLLLALGGGAGLLPAAPAADPLAWPAQTRECRPGAYWWWMGSAVDPANLTRELERYHAAGLGAVHIIPIYGAKGWEDRFIPYLSSNWMALLRHTVAEANRLDLNVDMTTGTGWCFGGPRVSEADANASVVHQTYPVAGGSPLTAKFNSKSTQVLMAFGPNGQSLELTGKIGGDGAVDWTAPAGAWRVYAVSQKPSGQKVKRAAPGGEGHMLNLISPVAMTNYLRWFEEAWARYDGPRPRAQYHDSYEYRSDWAPDFLAQFAQRRGYRLQDELPALFERDSSEHAARVKCDYRQTVSEVMAEVTLPTWAAWARRHGFRTRNQAHGSPGNWLDLYAAADIPETEMFHTDRNRLISKFASSAAHVTGKPLVSSETGTWLNEHFTETLAEMKYLLDDLFLSGVNHVFYHGACYSPDEAGWPGWLFYASSEMNPRNSIWHDVPALNAYAARCQSVLQRGRPDNDLLLYWPIHEVWHNPVGLVRGLTVHGRDWFEGQPVGQSASNLWRRGYAFDYVSDRQLAAARATAGGIQSGGGAYRAVVVPPCDRMPLDTLSNLLALARAGATVIFEQSLPRDVPGWGNLEPRRAGCQALLGTIRLERVAPDLREARLGLGRVRVGGLEPALAATGIAREPLFDHEGLMGLRRISEGECDYFIANRSEQASVNGWIPLSAAGQTVVVMDPLSGRVGVGLARARAGGGSEVFLQLQPGESVILRVLADQKIAGPVWPCWKSEGTPEALSGEWRVKFLTGGPVLPAPFATRQLGSWTGQADTNAARFAGAALYALTFDTPPSPGPTPSWELSLGRVCQSARVRLNGKELGTLLTPPFRVVVSELKARENQLEIEVTSVTANRIRDLDQRGEKWHNYYDIALVNLDYKPFNAASWPVTDCGLLGPVTLTPVRAVAP